MTLKKIFAKGSKRNDTAQRMTPADHESTFVPSYPTESTLNLLVSLFNNETISGGT